jgi:serine protease Do
VDRPSNNPELFQSWTSRLGFFLLFAFCFLLFAFPRASGQESFTATAEQVNKKLVKLFGAGGFKGMPSYGTGILVSDNGCILTVNNHILNTPDLRVHLSDGRLYNAKLVAREPELDVALLKIEQEVENLPYFDIAKAAASPLAEPGDWVLCHSNQFGIATRSEPMSVQRGLVMAVAELRARRGIFDPAYTGEVYFIDTVACNPGAAGGIITNRKGELLGILGRELKSSLSNTWVNYAVPIRAKVEVTHDDGTKETVDFARFVKEGMEGKYKESAGKKRDKEGHGAYHGIVLVPNAVSVTPPYIEEILPGSPAAKAKLQPDDLIVYVDGELVPSVKMFRDMLKQTSPGVTLQLEVQRGTQLKTVKLTLENLPKEGKGKK